MNSELQAAYAKWRRACDEMVATLRAEYATRVPPRPLGLDGYRQAAGLINGFKIHVSNCSEYLQELIKRY